MLQVTAEKDLRRYGVHYVRRTRGTAMGMTISPVKAEIVFADEEKFRKAKTKQLRKEGFLLENEDINEVVNGVRYVDDLILMSKLLCVE